MSEFYLGWSWKKYYTSAQIRKLQKQLKKSYKKADLIKEEAEKIAEKEKKEADDFLEETLWTI